MPMEAKAQRVRCTLYLMRPDRRKRRVDHDETEGELAAIFGLRFLKSRGDKRCYIAGERCQYSAVHFDI
jgi:hypothetical protein